jgi:cytochrome o ubiquinol oxidase operon protein cyoD
MKLLKTSPVPNPLKSYVTGFVMSIALTLVAYFAVVDDNLSRSVIIGLIMTLAVAQLVVQLVFFLHLGEEKKPRFNLTTFVFALIVLITIVFGSLWIMNNLDYHVAPDIDHQIMEEEAIYR